MKITIVDPDNSQTQLDVDNNITIKDLKLIIQNKLNFQAKDHELVFQYIYLQENKTIRSYNIEEGNKVFIESKNKIRDIIEESIPNDTIEQVIPQIKKEPKQESELKTFNDDHFKTSAIKMKEQFTKDPSTLSQVLDSDPNLLDALLDDDINHLTNYLKKLSLKKDQKQQNHQDQNQQNHQDQNQQNRQDQNQQNHQDQNQQNRRDQNQQNHQDQIEEPNSDYSSTRNEEIMENEYRIDYPTNNRRQYGFKNFPYIPKNFLSRSLQYIDIQIENVPVKVIIHPSKMTYLKLSTHMSTQYMPMIDPLKSSKFPTPQIQRYIQALIDTGAQGSAIPKKLAIKCGLMNKINRRNLLLVKGVNRDINNTLGNIPSVKLKLGNKTIAWEFQVLNQLPSTFACIIGIDLFIELKCIIDFVTKSLKINTLGIELPLRDCPMLGNVMFKYSIQFTENNFDVVCNLNLEGFQFNLSNFIELQKDALNLSEDITNDDSNSVQNWPENLNSIRLNNEIATNPADMSSSNTSNHIDLEDSGPIPNNQPLFELRIQNNIPPQQLKQQHQQQQQRQKQSNQQEETNIKSLMDLGLSREKAIDALNRYQGDVELAANNIFFQDFKKEKEQKRHIA